MNNKNNQNIFFENYIKVDKLGFKLLTKLLEDEQDFNSINPIDDE